MLANKAGYMSGQRELSLILIQHIRSNNHITHISYMYKRTEFVHSCSTTDDKEVFTNDVIVVLLSNLKEGSTKMNSYLMVYLYFNVTLYFYLMVTVLQIVFRGDVLGGPNIF